MVNKKLNKKCWRERNCIQNDFPGMKGLKKLTISNLVSTRLQMSKHLTSSETMSTP